MLPPMHPLHKKITAAFMTAALIVPMTSGPASAQSSFVSGSSSSDAPSTNHDSKAREIEQKLEQQLVDEGLATTPEQEAAAEALLQRALNNELSYQGNLYLSPTSPDSVNWVFRVPIDEIDKFVAETGENNGNPIDPALYGVAVGKDADYYYVSISANYEV